jgi:hypothetical protein
MTFGYIHPLKYRLRVQKKWRRIEKLLVKKYLADQLRDDRGHLVSAKMKDPRERGSQRGST